MMKSLVSTPEATFLNRQWRLAKTAERAGQLQSALQHYEKARIEALWLLDYHMARGEQQAAKGTYTALGSLCSAMDDIENKVGSEDSPPALYLLLHWLQLLVPRGPKQGLDRVKT